MADINTIFVNTTDPVKVEEVYSTTITTPVVKTTLVETEMVSTPIRYALVQLDDNAVSTEEKVVKNLDNHSDENFSSHFVSNSPIKNMETLDDSFERSNSSNTSPSSSNSPKQSVVPLAKLLPGEKPTASPASPSKSHKKVDEVERIDENEFCKKFGIDELARKNLHYLPPEKQQEAMRKFRPNATIPPADYCKVFMTYVRKYRETIEGITREEKEKS